MKIKKICIILLALLAAASLTACRGTMPGPNNGAKESARPTASASPEATEKASESPAASDEASGSPEVSGSPESSEIAGSADPSGGPSSSQSAADHIAGFMQGTVVDPETVPELVRLLGEKDEYVGMSIRSITYEYYEEREAYYVVLQGEGEATHAVWVFADGSMIDADN